MGAVGTVTEPYLRADPYLAQLIPGGPGDVTEALNALSREGWDLVSLHPMQLVQQALAGPQAQPAAYCVFRRRLPCGLPIPKGGDGA